MSETKIKLAIYGKSFLTDTSLYNKLHEKFNVFFCKEVNQVWNTVEKETINVLLLKIGTNGKELELLKELQDQYLNLHVISVGLEKPKEHLIKAFKYGSNDFFKMPLNADLLIERIEGIVRRNEHSHND